MPASAKAVGEMAVSGDLHTTTLFRKLVKKEKDETLFLELTRRGYDLSNLRDNDETTTEIVQIR